jgi:hypothetical protein
MQIADAQREVRTVFLGGSLGPGVASVLWAMSGALGTWVSPRAGILMLTVGGVFIFPATLLILRMMGRATSLSAQNTLGQLATQVALTIPLNLPVVAAAALYRLNWFYPAFMVVVGAHYLPFAFLYGMWQFTVLGSVLIGAGVTVALYGPDHFGAGAWVAVMVFLAATAALYAEAKRQRSGGE